MIEDEEVTLVEDDSGEKLAGAVVEVVSGASTTVSSANLSGRGSGSVGTVNGDRTAVGSSSEGLASLTGHVKSGKVVRADVTQPGRTSVDARTGEIEG